MHDEIGAQVQRAGEKRRGAGGIHRHARACRMGQLDDGGDVADLPQGIGGRLQPDEFRAARLQRGCDRSCVGGFHDAHLKPAPDALGGEPVAQGPIHDLLRDDMIARRERGENSHRRRHARTQHHGACAMLKLHENGFGLAHGFVIGPPIGIAGAVLIVRVTFIGGGDMDGRHDGAARGVDLAERLGEKGAGFPLRHLRAFKPGCVWHV